ncbi:MAG: TonB-dependent receptor [Gammaproteobacteria bacterium]|nr:TonB-dependent receptor [Gammaproteobacteria bacterium]
MKLLFAIAALLLALTAWAQGPVTEEIIVTADWRERATTELATNVSVLDADTLADAGVQHFEDVMLLVPNLNWSGETSRPRYFQIRGIGEREQYQGAPNPSVGFIVDDIDFSGIGMVATLFDVEQIEVLRGPQGTRYGANALAGLINVRTQDPSAEALMSSKIDIGSDGLLSGGLAFGGPVGSNDAAYRVAVQGYQNDGFRDNAFSGRNDTNGRDELTTRAKLTWSAGSDWDFRATAMRVDLDNGYDAWANDNGLITRTDDPGKDSQRSTAGAFRGQWTGNESFDFITITTVADSDIEVSFDGDWGNDAFWGVPYDFTSATGRTRETFTQELRWLSQPGAELFSGTTSWVAGVYLLSLEESNDVLELFDGAVFRDLTSSFDADSLAVFGQLDRDLGPRTALSVGLRTERRDASYVDSDGVTFSPTESMAGGHVSLTHDIDEALTWFGSLVRGYKAGGFNIGPSIPVDRREFEAEALWSLETGVRGRWRDGRLSGTLGVFYSSRRDQQVSTSLQIDPQDPLSFVFFTDNAAEGYNYGIETEFAWQLSNRWWLDGSLALLRTKYDRFDSPTVALAGREQAHAPSYQFALGATYQSPSGFFARVDFQGRDAFFFDDSHDQRSEAYELAHVRVGYEWERSSVSLWVRNIFDETYAVRGFYFANDPNDPLFLPQLYTRLGDPRQAGVTMSFDF